MRQVGRFSLSPVPLIAATRSPFRSKIAAPTQNTPSESSSSSIA
jgi:hypothetical protein